MGLSLVRFLLRHSRELGLSRGTVLLVFATGALSGVSSIALLALINAMLVGGMSSEHTWHFLGLCLLVPLSSFLSQTVLIRISQRTSLESRMLLCQRIVSAPLRTVEELGPPRLLSVLTDDILVMTNVLTTLPAVVMNVVAVAGCLVYLGWLSPTGLLVVLAFLVVGTAVYWLISTAGVRLLRLARREQDELFVHFRALTHGTKELKLSAARRGAFLGGFLRTAASSYAEHNRAGLTVYTAAAAWGQALLFLLLGLLLFAAPTWGFLEQHAVVAFVLTVLYMGTPLSVVLSALPALSRANIAVQHIESLGGALASSITARPAGGAEPVARPLGRVELLDVCHSYRRERDDSPFVLGPLSLAFSPGEVIFLTGGNGSGKTTLAKLLTGLYAPEQGEILVGGQVVTPDALEHYRENFSVVFADFYLFDTLLGVDGVDVDERARRYLRTLQLEHKVKIDKGVFSTLSLSQGQRRRLALLVAYMEDRPFYVFDEWAADQDPQFKDVFYLEVLAELKARGKAVLVISHDDRYYRLADRVVKLENGKIVYPSTDYVRDSVGVA